MEIQLINMITFSDEHCLYEVYMDLICKDNFVSFIYISQSLYNSRKSVKNDSEFHLKVIILLTESKILKHKKYTST